jgi:iron complex transport system permease protein
VYLIVLPTMVAIAVACAHGRDLNVLLLGDEQARGAGIHVQQVRAFLLLSASLGTAAAVAVSGIIGFVGLIVPHAVRLTLGPDHRVLLPASALAGASFLVLADLAARVLVSPAALQVGTVTALAGAPVFLLLILRSQKESLA